MSTKEMKEKVRPRIKEQGLRDGYSGQRVIEVLKGTNGDLSEAKLSIMKALEEAGVNIDAVAADLQSQKISDEEAILRLISLSRAHGMIVQLQGGSSEMQFSITRPSTVAPLQSSHDNDRGRSFGGM